MPGTTHRLVAAFVGMLLAAGAWAAEEPQMIVIDGRPPADYRAPVAEVPPAGTKGVVILPDVPAFDWSFGCSATAAAMMMGYYDRTAYSNMYTGTANGGVCPLHNDGNPIGSSGHCSLSATEDGLDGRVGRGHVDDYWVSYGDPGPDPFVTNGWVEHTWEDCTGDFMGTNQAAFDNSDGSTTWWYYGSGDPLYDYIGAPDEQDGCHGMRLFVESRGYTVVENYTQRIEEISDPGKGFGFDDYMAEIDAGRPVMIHVTGHSMVGYGYDTAGQLMYIHDTWDWSDHTMTWASAYSGGMDQWGVSVIVIEPVAYSIPLTLGWNLIGYGAPGAGPVNLTAVSFTNGVDTKTWDEAVTAGWIQEPAFYYNANMGYLELGTPAPPRDSDELELGRGYWLLTYVANLELVIP